MTSVLIVAFDGLQPAQVTDELMPNLSALAAGGVTFARHHAVFPSVTRTNVASIVTGRDPGGHGLAANTLVVREFDPHVALAALEPELSQIAHKTGRVLLAPTLADTLSRHGSEYIAVGTGTSGNAYAQNPNAERSGGATILPGLLPAPRTPWRGRVPFRPLAPGRCLRGCPAVARCGRDDPIRAGGTQARGIAPMALRARFARSTPME